MLTLRLLTSFDSKPDPIPDLHPFGSAVKKRTASLKHHNQRGKRERANV